MPDFPLAFVFMCDDLEPPVDWHASPCAVCGQKLSTGYVLWLYGQAVALVIGLHAACLDRAVLQAEYNVTARLEGADNRNN